MILSLRIAARFSLVVLAAAMLRAQQIPAAVVSDPPPDKTNPATMESPDIPSHGAILYSVFYLASGAGPHPTVLLIQGFPGNEKNLDLAYSMRRAGWNVLVPFYRGSWGSGGTFSFTHALEDAQAEVQFVRDPQNVNKYHIDPKRIVLVGHSFGGFTVAYVTAHDPEIFAVAMISPADLGPSTLRAQAHDPQELLARYGANASRLAGTTVQALLDEVKQNAPTWNYVDYAPALKNRPVLIVEADDRNLGDNRDLASALRKAGNARVIETHLPTDHSFSDHRIALQAIVVDWLQGLAAH